MKRILIIPSAGRATRLSPLNRLFPKVLMPCGDKPALSIILEYYKNILIHQVIIIVCPEHVGHFRRIIENYRFRFPVTMAIQKTPLGLLDSIAQVKEEIAAADQVLIHLADTIMEKPLQEEDLKQSWILSAKVNNPRDWCMVKYIDKKLVSMADKPADFQNGEAICGVYFFHRVHRLLQALKGATTYAKPIHGELQVSSLIERYKVSQPVIVHSRDDWQDVGSLQRLHSYQTFYSREKTHLVRQGQRLVKESKKKHLCSESFYYQNIQVPEYFPRIFDIQAGRITMSFEPLRSLAYLFLYESIEEESTRYILEELWSQMVKNFYSKCSSDSMIQETEWMYGQRIVNRVEELSSDAFPLSKLDYVWVNNMKLAGWPRVEKQVLEKAKKLARNAVFKHIHGDFHCANILYDPLQHIFVFVDPRGKWGKRQSVYGDIRYDFAKFLHSFHGGYEFIKNNLSYFNQVECDRYLLKMPSDLLNTVQTLQPILDNVAVEIEDVLWIEALCFLSMGKFYSDTQIRQQFFLRGLYLINQLL